MLIATRIVALCTALLLTRYYAIRILEEHLKSEGRFPYAVEIPSTIAFAGLCIYYAERGAVRYERVVGLVGLCLLLVAAISLSTKAY